MSHDNGSCIQIADAIRAQGIEDLTSELYVRSVFTLLYGWLFGVGLIGNGGVLWAVAHNRRLRSARNIFLLNLIATDLLLVLTAVPVTPWYALTRDWQFGSVMCHIVPLSNSCSCFVTSWSLTAISLDKYLHIIDPTRPPVTKKQALLITILIWVVSTLINVPYLLSFKMVDGTYYVNQGEKPFCGHFCDEANWQSENSRKLYGTMVMLLQFVVPMAIITYCYSKILEKSQQGYDHSKRSVNYILIAMVVTFIGCWLPLTLVNLVKDYKSEPEFLKKQPFLWPLVAHVIAMSLVIWNPLLFFWLTRKQKRTGLSKILNTSEAVASFASRIGSSVRRLSFRQSSNSDKIRKKQSALDSEGSSYTTCSRPLLIRSSLRQTLSDESTKNDL
ncbi:unnamed protein product [Caenorhabditis auriculariae]|uniref:G-protein coupled receptors family 1 profile domain-containing protein n=1 Tax=Caenorhabditis auriculariae TaxID=2777116 RepID=A0A8S1HAZ6_9PELO|nr:unnamed protein product [Caenorhabditis auriculariae]